MYYVGIMSGTSLDGIDAVLAKYDNQQWQIVGHSEMPLPDDLKKTLYQLNFPHVDDAQRGGELHMAKTAEQQITACYAEVYHQLIKQTALAPETILAIGAHGQTIRHEPNGDYPYTVQLLNGALLSHLTQQTVICDFRSKDIAAGGQGAPLAPIFHQYLFQQTSPFAVINIGGIANISIIDKRTDPTLVSGFDCGTGNCLMDEWIYQQRGVNFDKDGQWAATGQVLPTLLSQLLADDYFALAPPKSTGRDYFNPTWLSPYLSGDEAPQDVMRTLLELTARGITDSLPDTLNSVILAGGGAKNPLLVQRIKANLLQRGVNHTDLSANQSENLPHVVCADNVGIDAQHVEALGFAVLAKQCLSQTAIDTRPVTGATTPVICGAVYYN